MARNYILGGQAGTQLQAGKPYFKRIVRINGAGDVDRNVAATTHPGSVGYTVQRMEKSHSTQNQKTGTQETQALAANFL